VVRPVPEATRPAEPRRESTAVESPAPEKSGSVTPAAELFGTDWTLKTLAGQPAQPGNRGKRLTLRLADDGTALGFAGCNQFTAKFSNTRTDLRLKPKLSTKLSCPRGMTLEREYLDQLGRVDRWRRNGRDLELWADDQLVAVYERP
jgi:heat shock protein HslJ